MFQIRRGSLLVIAGSLILASWGMRAGGAEWRIPADALMIAAAAIAGYPIAKRAVQALRYRIIGIELLVTVAVTGAFYLGEYWEAAAVTFLFVFGSFLEGAALEKTRSRIRSLLELAPALATVFRNGQPLSVAADEVRPGETVLIRPGEKIPVDGKVAGGAANVNQAAVTGESMPVRKTAGDSVFSGTVIEGGSLEVVAERVGEDTTFSRILRLVEEAQDAKAGTQRFIEKFAKRYTPAMAAIALLTYLIGRDLAMTLTFLVIACPGALVISVPVSIVAGIGRGARAGILIKGGDAMERMGKVDIVAFDKTGTLTIGKPRVVRVQAYGIDADKLLQMAARAERKSEHPLAQAILDAAGADPSDRAKQDDGEAWREDAFVPVQGRGIAATMDGKKLLVGNRAWMADNGILVETPVLAEAETDEASGRTVVFVADEERLLGTISIADVVREEAGRLVEALHRRGIRTVMLTGDNARTAEAIASQLGIREVHADLLPEDKSAVMKRLQASGTAAMVGDGINDAPALATADVGIAIGGTGSDAAMETADVVLMAGRLERLLDAVRLARATLDNMRVNIGFSIFIVGLLLIGVLLRSVHLASGMLIHEASVLIVILNALRLLRTGKPGNGRTKNRVAGRFPGPEPDRRELKRPA